MGAVADEELLEAWRCGSNTAGSELFKRHFDLLHRFFSSKVTSPALVDDLVQQTFLGCLERPPTQSCFRAYLLGIARRRLMRFFRGVYRERKALSVYEPSAEDLMPSLGSALDMRKEVQIVASAIRRIPLDLQMALELYYQESFRVREIADILEIPPGTVKSRLSRARTELARAVETLHDDPKLIRSTNERLDFWTSELGRAAAAD